MFFFFFFFFFLLGGWGDFPIIYVLYVLYCTTLSVVCRPGQNLRVLHFIQLQSKFLFIIKPFFFKSFEQKYVGRTHFSSEGTDLHTRGGRAGKAGRGIKNRNSCCLLEWIRNMPTKRLFFLISFR